MLKTVKVNKVLNDIGISKVKLANYFGVSRQMIYNYLENDDANRWPKDKKVLLLKLLNIDNVDEIAKIKITSTYIDEIENRIEEALNKEKNNNDFNLTGLNREEQELICDLFFIIKEKLLDTKTKSAYNSLLYMYHFLQTMENSPELKYMLAYVSKSAGLTDPYEFIFNEDNQYVFESILYSAITLYRNGNASKSKIGETHKRFVRDIETKKEEALSRTQELNTAKIQALKELGYTEINADNAAEVLEKIAEIQARNV